MLSCRDSPLKKASNPFSSSIDISKDLLAKFDSTIVDSTWVFHERDTLLLKPFQRLYAQQDYSSYWLGSKGFNELGKSYIEVLPSVKYDGLNPTDYAFDTLQAMLQAGSMNAKEALEAELTLTKSFLALSQDMVLGKNYKNRTNKEWKSKNDSLFDAVAVFQAAMKAENFTEVFEAMRPKHKWYQAFRNEYIRLDNIQRGGSWATLNTDLDSLVLGMSKPIVSLVRKRLHREIGLPEDTSNNTWTPDVVEALKKFQFSNHVKVTGQLDSSTLRKLNGPVSEKLEKLALNMERMRWLRHDFEQPFIWVAIPKMEMEYVENDSIQFAMRVVVGRTSRPTPSLDSRLENIVFSPPWIVPPTIMKEEIVPGIARRGGSYLARRGLKAYDRRGRVVNASAINSRNYRNFSIGQAPGYRSSLGEIKFNMPNPWSIYMHDTPHREDFVKNARALSSGCVRVHKPKEFAAFLLRDTINYSYAKVDSICKLRKTIFVPMKRKVNVHFVYLTNALDSAGNVMYLRDIYGWDKVDG